MGSTVLIVISIVTFSLPISGKQSLEYFQYLSSSPMRMDKLMGAQNPMRLSPTTITFIRDEIPQRSRILVDPLSNHMIGAMAAVRQLPYPKGQLSFDGFHISDAVQGKHRFFNRALLNDTIKLTQALQFLDDYNIDFILVSNEYVSAMRRLATRSNKTIEQIFGLENSSDAIFKVTLN